MPKIVRLPGSPGAVRRRSRKKDFQKFVSYRIYRIDRFFRTFGIIQLKPILSPWLRRYSVKGRWEAVMPWPLLGSRIAAYLDSRQN